MRFGAGVGEIVVAQHGGLLVGLTPRLGKFEGLKILIGYIGLDRIIEVALWSHFGAGLGIG